jgi:hypothetical protein
MDEGQDYKLSRDRVFLSIVPICVPLFYGEHWLFPKPLIQGRCAKCDPLTPLPTFILCQVRSGEMKSTV